ncbi:MAG: hypothetical protein ABEK17_04175 [Candidatus Aenigmatarchaeota archaeon]
MNKFDSLLDYFSENLGVYNRKVNNGRLDSNEVEDVIELWGDLKYITERYEGPIRRRAMSISDRCYEILKDHFKEVDNPEELETSEVLGLMLMEKMSVERNDDLFASRLIKMENEYFENLSGLLTYSKADLDNVRGRENTLPFRKANKLLEKFEDEALPMLSGGRIYEDEEMYENVNNKQLKLEVNSLGQSIRL